MPGFSPLVARLVELALTEDLCGTDVTTDAIFDGSECSESILVAKSRLVLAGAAVFEYVVDRVSSLPGAPKGAFHIEFEVDDGDEVDAGTRLAQVAGPTVVLLQAERVGLNFLQRLSGIATTSRRYARLLGGEIRLTDTRKTTPGLRELERYAVFVGGGSNHRFNLGAGVLIKENHIRAAGGIEDAIVRARKRSPHSLRIEVETTNLSEVREALGAGADVIMLDNMSLDEMRGAIDVIAGDALIEVSGNITEERLSSLAALDIDIVSSGALTHSVTAADISMLFAT